MASPTSESVPHFIESGTGEALLFIHGAGGNAAIWWQQMAAFSGRNRAVACDLPGFGRTSQPTLANFSRHFASAGAAVLDAAEIEQATVVGHSLGGWSALRLAIEHPRRVGRLVLSSSMAGIAHPPALSSFQASTSRMDERGPTSLALSPAFKAANPAMAYLYDEIASFNPPLYPALGVQVFSPEVLVPIATLADISCPVLIIAAEDDPIWPPAALSGLLDAFPNARMETVASCGHSPYFENPAVFNSIVQSFIDERP